MENNYLESETVQCVWNVFYVYAKLPVKRG